MVLGAELLWAGAIAMRRRGEDDSDVGWADL